MSENKCCGNCKRYKPMEEIDGMCTLDDYPYDKNYRCDCYKPINNGWTEITPDNENELTDELSNRIIIGFKDCEGRMHTMTLLDCYMGVGTMAKGGGYYYYVLPELKIE